MRNQKHTVYEIVKEMQPTMGVQLRRLGRQSLLGLALMAAGMLAAPALTRATPITWTLQGVTFQDGGTASGTIQYDADTNHGSDWNISVSGGNTGIFPAITYTPTDSTFQILAGTFVFDGPQAPSINPIPGANRNIRFNFDAALTNAGGTEGFNQAGLGSIECYNCSPFRLIVAGDVSTNPTSPVPEPATLLLFGTGLLGAGTLLRQCRVRALG